MAVQIRPTRVVELVEEGRFDDILVDLGEAVLKRHKLLQKRKERQDKLRERREKRAKKKARPTQVIR